MHAILEDVHIAAHAQSKSVQKKAKARIHKLKKKFSDSAALLQEVYGVWALLVLEGDLDDARDYLLKALFWQNMMDENFESLVEPALKELGNDAGLVHYLTEKIPCNCLEIKKQEVAVNDGKRVEGCDC